MKFQKTTLPNGLTIIHERRDVPVTTVMLGVRFGAAYEKEEEKGIAHFIEHLCFKGTEKRTAEQIAAEVEKLGGDLNAFTSEEVTAYHVKLPSRHLRTAMNVIFDIFFNASFPEQEVEKEANVICEEIKMYRDNPRAHTLDKIKEMLYERPFGMSIAGSEENVRGMTREQLFKKHREIYVPKNSILVVVGNNDFEEVVELAREFVVDREGITPELPEIRSKVSEEKETRSNLNQTNIALGIHFPRLDEKERYAAELFSTILGKGMSSKLFKEVREKRGLVYGIRSELDAGKNYSYLIIWAGTDPSKEQEVIKISKEEFQKMAEINEKELEEAKVQVLGNRDVESEESNQTALEILIEEIAGDAENYYSYEEKIKEVQLDDIKKLSEKAEFAQFVLGPG